MLLAIDVGNTNMEFGLYDNSALIGSFRLGTKHEITSDEIGIYIRQCLWVQEVAPAEIEDVVIASVVPQVMYSLGSAVIKYLDCQPLVIGDDIKVNIDNRYQRPEAVGADRIVAAYAAYHKYGGPLVVIDFGTATTLDAVDKSGAYLGGAIYPGVKISMDALFQKAAKLPRIELVNPGVAIGKNTEQSMQSGVYHGYLGAVQNIATLMANELGGNVKRVATGGLSTLFAGSEGVFDAVDKTLTLDGIHLIYSDYKKSAGRQAKAKAGGIL